MDNDRPVLADPSSGSVAALLLDWEAAVANAVGSLCSVSTPGNCVFRLLMSWAVCELDFRDEVDGSRTVLSSCPESSDFHLIVRLASDAASRWCQMLAS